MTTSLTAYTQLESLLLFQSLHAYGLAPQVFSRISDLLKNNPHITANERYESGRLSPDALRNFYLHILHDEIRSEHAPPDADANANGNGDVKNSRKRKAPSPTLPTVQESVQHQHLIPKLVNKLYARYRAAITDQIRHDEERYERLQHELQGIERGECDHLLKEKANGKSTSRSPSLPKKSPQLGQQPSPSKASPHSGASDSTHATSPPPAASGPEGAPQQPASEAQKAVGLQNGQAQPERSAKTAQAPSSRKKQAPADQPATPQAPTAPTLSPQQNRTPQALAPPPQFQGQQPAGTPYNASPLANRSPFPQAHTSGSSQHGPAATSSHPPYPQASGPPGPQLQPQPIQPFGGNGIPQYSPTGAPPQFSPTRQRFPGPHQPGPQSPSVQTPPPTRNYLPYSGQPPYPPQQQMGQPPPQGGFMLPPFQVSPQDPSRAQQPTQTPQYPQVSTPVTSRQLSAKGTPQSALGSRHGLPPMHPLVTQARHSFSTPSGMRSPHSAVSTPRSARSVWKASGKSFPTPEVSRPEVAPIDDFEPGKLLQQSPPKAKTSRRSRAKTRLKEKELEKEAEPEPEPEPRPESEQPPEEHVPEMETRQGRSRRKAPAKRVRPGSIASSQAGTSVRERSRSQSILSHTETIAADNESQTGGRIKSERGTSIDVIEEDTVATPQMTTRRRGGNLQTTQPSNKRKRNAREVSPEETEEQSNIPGIPKTIAAPRHFSRMCAPLMNDIGSHKYASTFTTAVKAKDAEGYYEIIKRPTDLKSIQKAIAMGAKQVSTAASGDTPAGSPGGGGGVVELPLTADNIPPKAIVNAAQLEKELMRMFVNAVMFNAGEEGVVDDAREMFEGVQRSVSSWRSVDSSSGRLEVEETPPVGLDDELPMASKRRKV